VHWRELKASDLVLADATATFSTAKHPVEDTAFFIHSRLHLKTSEGAGVLHTHMPYATALTIIEQGRLEMVSQNALQFYGRIAYLDDYEGLALDHTEGDRMAAAMGDKTILFPRASRHHRHRPDAARGLERSLLPGAGGDGAGARDVHRSAAPADPGASRRQMVEAFTTNPDAVDQPRKHLEALKRLLDKEAPDYRN